MPQAFTTPAPINWHESPIAQRLIARLHSGNVERRWHIAIPADFWTYAGTDRWAVDVITSLDLIREVAVEEAAGFRMSDAKTSERAAAYLAVDDRAPNVTQVIEAAFAARDVRAAA